MKLLKGLCEVRRVAATRSLHGRMHLQPVLLQQVACVFHAFAGEPGFGAPPNRRWQARRKVAMLLPHKAANSATVKGLVKCDSRNTSSGTWASC